MADKEKKVTQDSKVDKATTDESKAAEKVAKAAKGNKKSDKPNFFARAGKTTKKFFKDFKGEAKKIVWPDAKTVLKNTGIVLIVVTIVTLIVLAIDSGLSAGVKGLKNLALGEETTVEETTTEHDHDHEGDEAEETTKAKDDSEEVTTAANAEETTAEDEAETTAATEE
ncbi:MAG: preprotein translocase subunit SecE [Clostridia bacterium]|nr:preprotein translocase subunit SecE [Clostridia bacterium]